MLRGLGIWIVVVVVASACGSPTRPGANPGQAPVRSPTEGSAAAGRQADSSACTAAPVTHDVVITSPAEVWRLRGVGRVEGHLRVLEATIETLDGLECLKEVRGDVSIGGNAHLQSVHGLRNLRHVSGRLEVSRNEALRELDFPSLRQVEGRLILSGYAHLRALDGFAALEVVDGIMIKGNRELETISGFRNLRKNTHYLDIDSNPKLTEISGFSRLRRLGGPLLLVNNLSLHSVAGFSHLETIDGMTISECPFESLADFFDLRQVTGSLILVHLHELKRLGLTGLIRVNKRITLSVIPIARADAEAFVSRVHRGPKEHVKLHALSGQERTP